MLAPLSWLKDFTPLEVDPDDDALALRAVTGALDSLGLVVESVELVGAGLAGVVLARVLEIREIKGADRIRQVVVDGGDANPLEIVCGATNYVLGDVVPLAPVGTELPGGMRIERRMMRGVESNGMLCSGRELGLSEDGAGLMILASPGADGRRCPTASSSAAPLTEYLGLEPDVVFDIAVEPNRPGLRSRSRASPATSRRRAGAAVLDSRARSSPTRPAPVRRSRAVATPSPRPVTASSAACSSGVAESSPRRRSCSAGSSSPGCVRSTPSSTRRTT